MMLPLRNDQIIQPERRKARRNSESFPSQSSPYHPQFPTLLFAACELAVSSSPDPALAAIVSSTHKWGRVWPQRVSATYAGSAHLCGGARTRAPSTNPGTSSTADDGRRDR